MVLRQKRLRLFIALLSGLGLLTSPLLAQDQSSDLVVCHSFNNFAEQSDWWMLNYGPALTAGSLFLNDSSSEELRIGQLFLMLRKLQERGQSDLQKHLAIEAELFPLLASLHGGEPPSTFDVLGQSTFSELGIGEVASKTLLRCAFECPSGEVGGVSDGFKACLEE